MNVLNKASYAILMLLIGESACIAQASAQAVADAKTGYQLYMSRGCFQCHGTVGQGNIHGPKLTPNAQAYEKFSTNTREPPNEMPPFSEKILSEAELRAIHVYVVSIPQPLAADSIKLLPRDGGQ
jgi:ubiquinol-cytochrome c reductase cytochrome c subunit